MDKRRAAIAAPLCAAIALASGSAQASSFQLREGDPDWLANAFAGTAAKAYDAGTVWNNPAGMTLLDSNEIDDAVNYFDPGIRFSGQDVVGGKDVSGGNGGDAGPAEVSAGFEGVWNAFPDLKFGAAAEAPYGLRTSYPANFVGRYQAQVSSIFDLQLALAAAYRITPQFSIGGGPVLTYFHARLTQAINTQAFVPGAGDSIVDIHGDDIAAGYHLGVLYQFTDSFRVGLDYHSRIGVNVTGQQRVAIPPAILSRSPFVGDVLQALNQPAATQIALPDYATVSSYYDIGPQLSVMTSVQWTDWSLIKTLSVELPTSVEATPLGFRNTWMGAVGANYRPPMFARLTLQTGVLYDEGANTDATRGPRLPDEDRIGLSAGFSFAITPRMNFRLAYLHEFPGFGSNKVDYTNNFPNAGTLVGTFANDADVMSAGLTMRF
jgi:long-chain fatty acid transport protein